MTNMKKAAAQMKKENSKDGTQPRKPTAAREKAEKAGASPDVRFPIVGIGASAGGLAAFEAFFSGMPADVEPGMAFVLVQHLAPDHKSLLTELIRRYTRMQVFEVEDGMEVRPNCAYIIPPNRDMALMNGALQLLEPVAPRGQRLPIDFFFRSLAHDQRERAICIVLSGTGSDGTLGVRAIKDEGGIAMAQSPESCEYDGMPQSAIATGLVDYELKPSEMPAQLIGYVAHAFGKTTLLSSAPPSKSDSVLKKIYVLLRAQTGHDFSQYKPSTIHRRIERRMAINQIESIGVYLKHLQQAPLEVEALFRDLLIGVTNFFRDPEAFTALEEQVIPALLAGKPAGSSIRVWSPGCSTGEEAYSIAILLQERLEAMKQHYKVQVFATDIDARAIATARVGLYPASIAADVSPERLVRFFSLEADGSAYRIHKGIRDMLIFSEQDVVKDPPFSRLDLISCRNLMIYMSADLQKRLIPMFHYALNPNAFLFLGSSETVGEFGGLFTVLNRKQKLYRRQEDTHSVQRVAQGRFLPPSIPFEQALSPFAEKTAPSRKPSLRELTEQALLRQIAPAAALINRHGDILYLHGRSGHYLEPAQGEVGINNIVTMAREGLRHDLTTALHQVVSGQKIVRQHGLLVKTNGDFTSVDLTVCPVMAGPVDKSEATLYLVILEEATPSNQDAAQPTTGSVLTGEEVSESAKVAALKQELHAKEVYLQASNEELKSFNEEMQSMNEELQSTNEELETSKEELQSINEELATVNAEMQTKVADLSRANNDISNLLAGTGIATVFVDHQQRILNFTPGTAQIINLIVSDVGRPIGHFVSNLTGYDRLPTDVQAVLDTLIPIEREVRTTGGEWYMMRILPYRTSDNVIEGAVINFVNITDKKRIEEKLRENSAILQAAMDHSMVGIAIAEAPDGALRYVNEAGLVLFGEDHTFIKGLGIEEYVSKYRLVDMQGQGMKADDLPLVRAIRSGEKYSMELMISRPNDKDRVILANAVPIKDAQDQVVAGVMIFIDISELRHAESNAWLSAIVASTHDAIISRDFDGRIRTWNRGAEQMFGYSAGEMVGQQIDLLFSAEQPEGFDDFDILSHGAGAGHSEPYCQTKNGRRLAVQFTQSPIIGPGGEPVAVSVIMSDISAIKEMQQQVVEANADLGKKVAERTLSLQQSMGQLRRLALELTQTEQRERQRLATVLHNDLQQILVAAGLRLERLSNTETSPDKQEAIQQVETLLMQAVAATRSLATDLRPPVLNSGNLVKSLQWLAEWLWKRFDFTLKFSMPEDLQTEAIPDEGIVFLFDTARELCFNIVKHAHVKEGCMTLERMVKNRLRLSIADDGVGVDLAQHDLPESIDGGLGLRAIQDRLALIGGEMRVNSAAGQGFRADITLPYAMRTTVRQQPLRKGEGMVRLAARSLPAERKIRVILVDDHTVVRDGLKMILLDETDIDVIGEAADGEKAVKLVDRLHPDVVIMDVNMPKMNGIEATKLIKQAHPEICVIALSINDDPGTNNAMLEAGACVYLSKSGSAEDVCEVIRACQREKPATIVGPVGKEGGGTET